MTNEYKGEIGPEGGMDATSPEFIAHYEAAVEKVMGALIEFEHATGRVVDDASLKRIDVTRSLRLMAEAGTKCASSVQNMAEAVRSLLNQTKRIFIAAAQAETAIQLARIRSRSLPPPA